MKHNLLNLKVCEQRGPEKQVPNFERQTCRYIYHYIILYTYHHLLKSFTLQSDQFLDSDLIKKTQFIVFAYDIYTFMSKNLKLSYAI